MASTEAVQSTDQPEKIAAIGAAAEENEGISAGRVSKRPFVLKKSRGPSVGHLAMMLIVAGTLAVLAIAMVALLSTTSKNRKRTMEENASDIERTKSPQLAQSPALGKSARLPKTLGGIGKFEEPDNRAIVRDEGTSRRRQIGGLVPSRVTLI